MDLLTSKVPRALDAKPKLLGLELTDLAVVFLYLSLSNLFFGTTSLKVPLVWGVSLGLFGFLYFFKRGKPDHYLQDVGEYFAKPDVYSAGAPDLEYQHYLPLREDWKKEPND
jgi:hypothetical protein